MTRKTLLERMAEYGAGTFSQIHGTTYGFEIDPRGRTGCEIFDTIEADDYRLERFPDAASALDGFLVDGKPLAAYGPTVEPVLTNVCHAAFRRGDALRARARTREKPRENRHATPARTERRENGRPNTPTRPMAVFEAFPTMPEKRHGDEAQQQTSAA